MIQDILNQLPMDAEVFIMGDFNIGVTKTNSPSQQALKGFEHTNNFLQLIKSNTWTTNRSSSLIDLICTNSGIIQQSGIMNINISDHLPIYAIRKKNNLKQG